jgi:hypothetical protein
MMQIALPDPIFERLQNAALQTSTNLSELLVQAVEFYLASAPEDKLNSKDAIFDSDDQWEIEQQNAIEREMQAYRQQHPPLLTQYPGEPIAMLNGQVIDHDSDETQLSQRIRFAYGKQPILITPVLAQPEQTIFVRSPRFVLEPVG